MRRAKRGSKSRTGSNRRSITVGIVARPAAEREAFSASMDAASGFRAIDCGPGTAESVDRVRDLAPEVILIDLDLGPATSFAASVIAAGVRTQVASLLHYGSEEEVARLAAVGVTGFVPPGAGIDELLRILGTVRRRGFACPPELTSAALRRAQPRHAAAPKALRGRLLEVAECVAAGMLNKEIADRLGIGEGTVKNHVHRLLLVLGVTRRSEVAPLLGHARPPFGLVHGEGTLREE